MTLFESENRECETPVFGPLIVTIFTSLWIFRIHICFSLLQGGSIHIYKGSGFRCNGRYHTWVQTSGKYESSCVYSFHKIVEKKPPYNWLSISPILWKNSTAFVYSPLCVKIFWKKKPPTMCRCSESAITIYRTMLTFSFPITVN